MATPLESDWKLDARRMLSEIETRVLCCEVVAEEDMLLGREPASVVRSALGRACKEDGQLFDWLFEPPPALRGRGGMSHGARPLVIRVDDVRYGFVPRGGALQLELVLFGPLRLEIARLLDALARASRFGLGPRRSRFLIRRIRIVEGADHLRGPATARGNSERVVVDFLTPARLVSGSALHHEIRFDLLVKCLLRRYAALATSFGDGDPPWDFARIIGDAAAVECDQDNLIFMDRCRWSSRQRRSIPVGGVLGYAMYRGKVAPFLPLLRTGELIHIGKGTLMGHGRFRISSVERSRIR